MFYFTISADAAVFKTTHRLCNKDGERIEFYKDGTCVIRLGGCRYEATYSIETSSYSKKEIIIKCTDNNERVKTYRGDIKHGNEQGASEIYLEGYTYKTSLCEDK